MTYPNIAPTSGSTTAPIVPVGPNGNQGVGAGNAAQSTGAVPPANSDGVMGAILESVPLGGSVDSTVLSLEIAAHLQNVVQKLYAGEVKVDNQQREAALAEKMSKLKDALDKLAHMQDDHHSFWDILGDVLGAIASVLAIVVGAILCVVPGTQALGVLCIVGGCIGLTATANAITQQATGHGFAGLIVKAFGGSEKAAEDADLGFSIALAVAALVVSVVCIWEAPATLGGALSALQTASNVVSAGTTVVTAVGDVSVAAIDYSNAEKTAAAKRDQAAANDLAAWVTEIDHFIAVALQNMKASADAWAGTVRDAADTLAYVNQVALQSGKAA
jgi:hypothetical protein